MRCEPCAGQLRKALTDTSDSLGTDRAPFLCRHPTPKLRLYLDGYDVHDPWEDAYTAFQDCVAVIERGAARHLP